jgi:hypothetical protein
LDVSVRRLVAPRSGRHGIAAGPAHDFLSGDHHGCAAARLHPRGDASAVLFRCLRPGCSLTATKPLARFSNSDLPQFAVRGPGPYFEIEESLLATVGVCVPGDAVSGSLLMDELDVAIQAALDGRDSPGSRKTGVTEHFASGACWRIGARPFRASSVATRAGASSLRRWRH